MPLETSLKLTYEDFLLLPDDGRRHEILDGEHYVNPAPNTTHFRLSKRLVQALLPCEQSGLGEVFYAPYDVVLSSFDVVEPDLFFVRADRLHLIGPKHMTGAPDLVIEILSESNRQYDERVKYQIYERLGVGEYWIVDSATSTVKVYRRAGERFEAIATAEVITTPLLPGFALSVRDLFA